MERCTMEDEGPREVRVDRGHRAALKVSVPDGQPALSATRLTTPESGRTWSSTAGIRATWSLETRTTVGERGLQPQRLAD
jgi:hypothetical protein